MHYEVLTVTDDQLPEGTCRVIVERVGKPPLLIVKGEPARTWRFMRTFEDATEPPVLPTILRAV